MGDYERLNVEQIGSETDPFTEDRYRQFFAFFPKNARSVLDVGCNTGRGGTILKGLDERLLLSGLDVLQDRLDRLPRDVYQQAIHGLSTNIPADDCAFDVVVAGEFIEHLYPRDVDQTLAEAFRVLKVGGRFLLTTPNPRDIKRRLRKESLLGGAHLSQHFHDTLKLKLKMTGFAEVRVFGSGKVTWYLGYRFPMLSIYGSYLAIGDKF
jgi:SAM-dependent methyltransferase